MDIRQMRYFQAVAEELSFSRASRRLNIAQPALSRAVQHLEEQLGAVLLHRTRRLVSLTPAGSVFLGEIQLLLQRLEESIRRVQRTAVGEEGELRLGYIGPPSQPFLGRVLRAFCERHPRVHIVLEERTPERVCEMVARGRLAIGLTRPVLASRALGLSEHLLRREPLCAVLPKEHRLASRRVATWKDLTHEPLIVLARREGVGLHDAILEACRQARFTPRLAHTPSLIGTVLSYVELGAGVGVIPDSVASLGIGGPLVFRPLTPTRAVDFVMVWSPENESPPTEAFRHLVLDWQRKGKLWPRS